MKSLSNHLTFIIIIFFCTNNYAQDFWEHCFNNMPSTIFVRPNGDLFVFSSYNLGTGFYISTDAGNSWDEIGFFQQGGEYLAFANNGYIYRTHLEHSVYYSTDNGNTWTNIGLTDLSPNQVVVNSNNDLFVSTTQGIYRSTDNGVNWTNTLSYGGHLRINSDGILFAGIYNQGMFRSTDNGNNWEIINTNLNNFNIRSLFIDFNDDVYVGTTSGEVYKSSDNGENWLAILIPTTNYITSIVTNSVGYIFVTTYSSSSPIDGIFRSTDGGNSWSTVNSGLMYEYNWGIVNCNDRLFVGCFAGIYRSTNITTPVELNSFTGFINNWNVVLNWSTSTETNNHGFEIQRRTENTNWATIGFKEGEGTTTETQSYSFTDANLIPGKYSYRLKQIDFNGTYKYSEIVEIEVAPATSSLSQNYPNPFNPTTTIKYSINKQQFVSLKVYDVLGNEVVTLVNKEQPAGNYSVEFNGSKLASGISAGGGYASGVYFYQLVAGDFRAIKKLILLK